LQDNARKRDEATSAADEAIDALVRQSIDKHGV
jgi:hypothetical protein